MNPLLDYFQKAKILGLVQIFFWVLLPSALSNSLLLTIFIPCPMAISQDDIIKYHCVVLCTSQFQLILCLFLKCELAIVTVQCSILLMLVELIISACNIYYNYDIYHRVLHFIKQINLEIIFAFLITTGKPPNWDIFWSCRFLLSIKYFNCDT